MPEKIVEKAVYRDKIERITEQVLAAQMPSNTIEKIKEVPVIV